MAHRLLIGAPMIFSDECHKASSAPAGGAAQPARPRDPGVDRTFREHGVTRLGRLCDAVGLQSEKKVAVGLFDLLLEGWGDTPIGPRPGWPSLITDDHSPYELSLAFEGAEVELRVLLEVQARPMSVQAGWEAGLEACQRLRRRHGTPLDRLERVADLFAPRGHAARFALWHALVFRRGQAPAVKVYLNPQIRGPEAAPALIEEALERLGCAGSWRYLADTVMRQQDPLIYFSLDLSADPSARVKVYLGHPGLTAAGSERLLATDPEHGPGGGETFCRAVLGEDGPYLGLAPDTCFAFLPGQDARPASTTLYLPVRDYAEDDRQAAGRVEGLLQPAQRACFHAALDALATRPLEAGVGLIQWVAIRRRHGHDRVTVYLSPQAHAAAPTMRTHGEGRLGALCDTLGLEAEKPAALRLFGLLARGWGQSPLGPVPPWTSGVTDDHSPYELSVAMEGQDVELRFLLEVQRHPLTLASGWQAALAASARLEQEMGVPLQRLRRVQDLFEPTGNEARFALWHAVSIRPRQAPDFKVYLNPDIRGAAEAPALMEEALRRLGLDAAWRFLSREVLRSGDRLAYLSLDLSLEDAARVKVYVLHAALTAARAERLMETDPGYVQGAAAAFFRSVRGGETPFDTRPAGTCLAFVAGQDSRPHGTTLYLPPSAYVRSDRETVQRLEEHLDPGQRRTLEAALATVAGRPLEAGRGLIQWVSFKRRNQHHRITCYIAPEAYQVMPPRTLREGCPS